MAASAQTRLVMFDLDGTMLDTADDLAEAANRMLDEAGLQRLAPATVASLIGGGIPNLVRRCLVSARPGQKADELPDEIVQPFIEAFRTHYRAVSGEKTRVYPGVIEALTALRAAGLHLACVTNKSTEFAAPLLERTGLATYFGALVCGDTLPEKKPHPLPLLHVCQQFAVASEHALMIGDSRHDIGAARAAGCPVFCVTYGYDGGEPVRETECDALLGSLAELPDRLGLPAVPQFSPV